MSDMNVFEIKNFGDTQLRVHFDDGTPWFALRDICKAIVIANVQTAIRYVPEDCKRKLTAKTKTGVRDILAVNKQGIGTLIERFPNPESVRFDHWLNNGLTGATVQRVDNENAIRVFENPAFSQKLKCYEKDGTVYLNLEAAARGLGFTQTKDGVEYVMWWRVMQYLETIGYVMFVAKSGGNTAPIDEDSFTPMDGCYVFRKSVENVTSSNIPEYIPENVFYRLAMKANNAAAEKFQAWIADEVIPDIRKHGMYMTGDKIMQLMQDPDNVLEVFKNYANEHKERLRLEQVVEQQSPKVEFADAVLATNQSITMKHMAALLKKNGVNVGRSRLFKFLRDDGYLCKLGNLWNAPTQAALEAGYFTVTEYHYKVNGERKLSFVTRVTPQGQMHLLRRYMKTVQAAN